MLPLCYAGHRFTKLYIGLALLEFNRGQSVNPQLAKSILALRCMIKQPRMQATFQDYVIGAMHESYCDLSIAIAQDPCCLALLEAKGGLLRYLVLLCQHF